jgi:hypothetical protein
MVHPFRIANIDAVIITRRKDVLTWILIENYIMTINENIKPGTVNKQLLHSGITGGLVINLD